MSATDGFLPSSIIWSFQYPMEVLYVPNKLDLEHKLLGLAAS